MQSINSNSNQFQMFDPAQEDFLQQVLASSAPYSSSSSSSWPSDLSALTDEPQLPWDPLSQTTKPLMLQQQLIISTCLASSPGNWLRSSTGGPLPMPLSSSGGCDLHQDGFGVSPNSENGSSTQALYNGFTASLGQPSHQSHNFHHPQGAASQAQIFGLASVVKSQPAAGSSGSGGGAAAQPRQQKVRARRGQATDPHSIAERLRRERIAERMRGLQELLPNANKTDKASMVEEIIEYVKFLQLQVKVLSMSRLGGAAAIAPVVGDISAEGGGDSVKVHGRSGNGTQTASLSSADSKAAAEQQVAKLMEEDMGSAMQYLQGKGLCLMPISLATIMSPATCRSRNDMNPNSHLHNLNGNNQLLGGGGGGGGSVRVAGGPLSPTLSVLMVQSAATGNGRADVSVRDAASVLNP